MSIVTEESIKSKTNIEGYQLLVAPHVLIAAKGWFFSSEKIDFFSSQF